MFRILESLDCIFIITAVSVSLIFGLISPIPIAILIILILHIVDSLFFQSDSLDCVSVEELELIYNKLDNPRYMYQNSQLLIEYNKLFDYSFMEDYIQNSLPFADMAVEFKSNDVIKYQNYKSETIIELEKYKTNSDIISSISEDDIRKVDIIIDKIKDII